MTLEDHSLPLEKDQNDLRIIFTLNPGENKKGRIWMPVYDARFPFTEEFRDLPFVYMSQHFEKNNASGNHYHLKKREIIIPIHGTYEFHLEHIETKVKETFIIDSNKEYKAVYIPLKVSHKIVSLLDTGSLLVLASAPSSLDDELEYEVN